MTDRVLSDGPYADRAERFTGVPADEHNHRGRFKRDRALRLVAYIAGLPTGLRWTKEFTRYVDEEADAIVEMDPHPGEGRCSLCQQHGCCDCYAEPKCSACMTPTLPARLTEGEVA